MPEPLQGLATAPNARQAHQHTGTLTGFGYATLDSPKALRELLGDSVEEVIDVRINRYSRIPAFSTKTEQTVEAAGYAYVALPELGNAGHRDGGPMRLVDPRQVSAIVELLRVGRNVAVMCACANPKTCHRRMVIELARRAIPELEVREL
jgi:uncharacterized protein (DUF488 family)